MSGNQAFRGRSHGPSEYRAAATTGAGTGAESLESKTVLRMRWKSSSEYLTTEESAEPETVSGAMTGAAAGVRACVRVGAGVQQSLSSVGVPPISSCLPS